ncbi:MAG: CHAD domain-containing protein [Terriglobales bacterium]
MAAQTQTRPPLRQTGIAFWMNRSLEELEKASASLSADPVHDLRVSLRRCRSIAEGFQAIDPLPAWRKMRKAGKEIFSPLGELRDTQVLLEWVEKLGKSGDAVTEAILAFLRAREQEQKGSLAGVLARFDRKQWQQWSQVLSLRARHIPIAGLVFEYQALERWEAAHALHRQALRNRSQTAFHQLRIGLKKLRYLVENFLPSHHQRWGSDLKELQDLLGEVHDLDVLWHTALASGIFADGGTRAEWRAHILEERGRRIDAYRRKMVGPSSLWPKWRAELPQGPNLQKAVIAHFEVMIRLEGIDVNQARRVARTALLLYDGLAKRGLLPQIGGEATPLPPAARIGFSSRTPRLLLHAAGLLHAISRAKKDKAYQKASARIIEELTVPVGWDHSDLQVVAEAVRYHRGDLPAEDDKGLRLLPPERRQLACELAAILRLSEALNRSHLTGPLKIETTVETIRLFIRGYPALGADGEKIATAKFFLESIINRPIVITGEDVASALGGSN